MGKEPVFKSSKVLTPCLLPPCEDLGLHSCVLSLLPQASIALETNMISLKPQRTKIFLWKSISWRGRL